MVREDEPGDVEAAVAAEGGTAVFAVSMTEDTARSRINSISRTNINSSTISST